MPVPAAGKPCPDLLRLVRRMSVHHQVHVRPVRHRRLDLLEEAEETRRAMAPEALADHRTGGDVERGERRCRAVAGMVAGPPLGHARRHRQDRLRPVRRPDPRLPAGARDDGAVRRSQSEPRDVLHLAGEGGSVDSLNVPLRCGFRPKADRIRCTVVCDTPVFPAMLRTDRCVAPFGIVSGVRPATSATLSSAAMRGRPERCSSGRPGMRFPARRRRHLPSLCSCTPIRPAICLLRSPSAHGRMILQRSDRDLGALCLRTCASRNPRSSPLGTTSTALPLVEPPPVDVTCRFDGNYRYGRLGPVDNHVAATTPLTR